MTYYTATRLGKLQAKTLNGIRYKAIRVLRQLVPADKVFMMHSHHLNIFYNCREMDRKECWVGNVSREVFEGGKEYLTWVEWKWKNGQMVDQRTYYIDDNGHISEEAKGRFTLFGKMD